MAAPSKAQLLNEVHTLLKRRYKPQPRPERMTVLEAVVYGICHEGTTPEQANQALSRFKDEFFDWNEVRVTSLREIQGVLAGLPETEERARRVRRFLQQLFSKTYSFTLDSLGKKPLKDAVKSLREFEAMRSDYVLATVVQLALGGHAIPIDVPIRRGLDRLGVADPKADNETLRGTLERTIPKNRGGEFADLMEELTHDTCVGGEPDCTRCELKKICPTGQTKLAQAASNAKIAAKQEKVAAKAKAKEQAKGTSTTKDRKPAAEPAPAPAKPAPKVATKPKPSAARDGQRGGPAAPKAKGKSPKK